VAFFAALALLLLLTYAPRISHYAGVQSDRGRFFAGEVMVAGPDSFYALRAAREFAERSAAPAEPGSSAEEPHGSQEVPWLARTLAFLANASDSNVYAVAPLFALLTGALFLIPAALLFARSGWPAAGLVGATLGASSAAVYARTSIFRIDTDAVILLGLWTASLLVAAVRPTHGPARQIGTTIAAGLATAFVVGWHDKPVYALAYLATFPLALLASRVPPARVALLTAIFAVFVGPSQIAASFGNVTAATELYGPVLRSSEPAVAPAASVSPSEAAAAHLRGLRDDTAHGISEAQRLPLATSLSRLLSPAWLAGTGLLLALLGCLAEWRRALPLLPILGLGLLGLLSSSRFLLFLAPFAGLGLGAALTLATRFVLERQDDARGAPFVSVLLAVPVTALLLPTTIWGDPLRQYLSVDLLRTLQRVRTVVPDGSRVWGHWGDAYPMQDLARVETPLASLPDPERGHLYLGALVDSDPQRLQRTIAYLDTHSRDEIRRAFAQDYAALRDTIREGDGAIPGPSHVALTRSSVRFFETHHRRGRWSAASGWPDPERIVTLDCESRVQGQARCRREGSGTVIDFRTGRVGRRPYSRLVFTLDGRIESDRPLPGPKSAALVVARATGVPGFTAFVMSEDVSRSLLVEMYLLGRFDDRHFALAYDGYPDLRLYRVRSQDATGGDS